MEQRDQFHETLVAHRPHLERIVKRVSLHQNLVDDVTQEVCLRIIEKEHLWKKEKGRMEQWMNTIARNLSLTQNHKEIKEAQNRQSLDPREENVPNFDEEQIAWVLNAFGSLSHKQQNVLKLKYYESMKVTDIATRLGLSHSTVSEHLNSGLKKLRTRAKAQGLLSLMIAHFVSLCKPPHLENQGVKQG